MTSFRIPKQLSACGSHPFYDLVSTVQYEGIDHELAMGYGDEFRLPEITPFQWADFAHRTGTPRSLLAREMRLLGKAR